MIDAPDRQIRVIAYIRKSSEDNEKGEAHKQLNSLEYQGTWVNDAVQKHNLELLLPPFEDNKTGYEAFVRDGENGFNEMLEFIKDKNNHVEGIICTEISRLARNFADGGMILWYLQNDNIKYIYTPTKVFTNSSSDQLMVAIEFAMSKKSSDDTGYRTKEGMSSKVRIMKHPSRPAVLGYRTEGPDGAKKWLIDEVTGPLVKKVFAQFATDEYTFEQITEYAHKIGLKSFSKRSKTGKYSENTLRNRLRDEQYIGIFYHDGERVVGEYEHLIDDITFYRVQETIRGNQHPKSQHIEYAYSGLIKCGLCGGMLSGTNKKEITYYRCGKRNEPCKFSKREPYATEKEIETVFIEKFGQIEIDQSTWKEARDYVQELNQPEKLNLRKEIRMLSEQVGAEENIRLKIGRDFADRLISKIEHDRLLTDSFNKEASLRNTIVKLENIAHELDQVMENFLENIKYVTKKFETSLPINKRELIEIFCENLVWKDGKVRWDWTKPYFILAKQPNNSNVLRD